MNTLLTFAIIEAAALMLLVVLVLIAPEAVEDEKGFRVVGPSLWHKLRMRAPSRVKVTDLPSFDGRTHA